MDQLLLMYQAVHRRCEDVDTAELIADLCWNFLTALEEVDVRSNKTTAKTAFHYERGDSTRSPSLRSLVRQFDQLFHFQRRDVECRGEEAREILCET